VVPVVHLFDGSGHAAGVAGYVYPVGRVRVSDPFAKD